MIRRVQLGRQGASAVEFALVLPLLLLFLFGIIDVGRYLWASNRAEKATQMAVRYAVVTTMVPSTLASRDFALNGGVNGGEPVPVGLFSYTECNNSSCSNGSWGYDGAAFNNILNRVRWHYPSAAGSNLQIRYDNVGLGFAGDPNGPDVSPLVTVRLTGLQFRPVVTSLFGVTFGLPDFQSSLTGEDFACDSVANSTECVSN